MKQTSFFFLFIFSLSSYCFGQADDQFIFHTVQPKETLYSLVKKYNTNFATVENLNPELAGGITDIKIGQVLKFPKANTFINKAQKPVKLHMVKTKETVFSISKLYDLDISNFVEVNKIDGNYIRIGDELIVDPEVINREAAKIERPQELHLKATGKKVNEIGLAEIIYTNRNGGKYLALHRDAPIGSNIKVTNGATGHSIVVKVIGRLAEKGPDENILIKLSPAAFYQLRPKDAKIRANVEYYIL